MLTISERHVNEATILDLKGTLLIPDHDEALIEAVKGCVRQVGEPRLVNSTRLVEYVSRLTRLDSLIPTFRVWPGDDPAGDGRPVRMPATPREVAPWWDAMWNAIYRIAAAACDALPV